MLIIGITGGSGSGKSTVANLFCEFGACTIDADAVYHKLLNESEHMLRELKSRFPDAVDNEGKLQRRLLAKIVFSDENALADLNAIAHKFVIEETEREIAQLYQRNEQCLCIDAIALFESKLSSICDVTIAVIAPRDVRAERIMARDNLDRDSALARIDAQQSDDFYKEKCDYVIINDGDSDAVRKEALNVFNHITKEPEE
ncbi:MAG: dephospho-CoA kinase [Oscillospiraceae bacterium]|nr:dephospho-CoA kinase [Oscillospiraceae bacterium]